ncbi:oligoribonuclease [Candidatus Saccharibacteria bacterium]|nr:MAG: oligoribonuclease [Candidatus Saccharibacteria bacterium]
MSKKATILWLDMEMTGLDPARDLALEVAVVATDWDFTEIASLESGIGYPVEQVQALLDANDFYRKYPANKKALLELTATSPAPAVVERQLLAFIAEHCDSSQPVLLAGNSIHQDRRFIRAAMPLLDQKLHYRMLDVSAWKLVFEAKFGRKYQKQESHRALDDVRESIAELQFYLLDIMVRDEQ